MNTSYVNLGCGGRYHPDWINIDVVAGGPGVIVHDLRRGIPLDDASCDVVYHAHVLEHFRRADTLPFLRECRRVLRPNGVIRVVVPDLEQICRAYLHELERALEQPNRPAPNYDWIMLELFDQSVREQSGGDMLAYLARPLPNPYFVFARIGAEGRALVAAQQAHPVPPQLRARLLAASMAYLRASIRRWRRRLGELPLRVILGADGARAYRIGRFRLAGEVHQWMYDRYSLARLLGAAGFDQVTMHSASTSAVPDWARFMLDANADGVPHKPDSLYMEARKP